MKCDKEGYEDAELAGGDGGRKSWNLVVVTLS